MSRGTNIEQTRAYNRRAITQTVRRLGVASRTDIARHTALSLQAVSNIVAELESEGLLLAVGRRATGRGQPPIEYQVNPDGAYSVGLSADHDHIAGVLIDAAGTVLARRQEEIDASQPRYALGRLAVLARALLGHLPGGGEKRLSGVALGVPGVVEEEGGLIARMVRLEQWEGLRVGELLSADLGTPVQVANDAILAALGELWFGSAREAGTFFYVLFALGMGSSLVLGGEPYGGPWGHRGRLSHIPVEPGGRPCPSCGGSGCLSLYTSMGALLEHLQSQGVDAREEDLESLHLERHPQLLTWLESAAHYLARGLVVLENLLAPDAIVFGGRMAQPLLQELVSRAGEIYRSQRAPLRQQTPQLLIGSHGAMVVTTGAAALPHYLATAASYRLVQGS